MSICDEFEDWTQKSEFPVVEDGASSGGDNILPGGCEIDRPNVDGTVELGGEIKERIKEVKEVMGEDDVYIFDIFIVDKRVGEVLKVFNNIVAENKEKARFKANVDHTIKTVGWDTAYEEGEVEVIFKKKTSFELIDEED